MSKMSVWVKWKHALASKDKGDLGVSSLFVLNRALMFKWVWRFITQGSSLWARVIKALLGYDEKIGQKVKSCYPSSWLDIIHEVEMFKFRGIDLALEGSGEFTITSVRKMIDDFVLPDVSSKTRWIKAVPIKVNVHAWKVGLDGLPTRLNISRRGIDIESLLCPITRMVKTRNGLHSSIDAGESNTDTSVGPRADHLVIQPVHKAIKCDDGDKVVYAVSKLRLEAKLWWDIVKDKCGPTKMTWSRFREVFKDNFCTIRVVMQQEEEFLTFNKQGNQLVKEYTAHFVDMARFAEHLVATEERKVVEAAQDIENISRENEEEIPSTFEDVSPPPYGKLYVVVPLIKKMEELHSQGKTIEDIVNCLNRVLLHPQIVSAIKSAQGCEMKVVSHSKQERVVKQMQYSTSEAVKKQVIIYIGDGGGDFFKILT
uniref:RNA-directed DNA polymerase, eukaryota, reverse transcriptase zinc-binding domain protein n=1 Tax=Tanacetum cinerariifolium TaxID=118510 RepID=A0A6L2JYT9_TANCI|nr:RNA-directed DNA polymerase, eukaryota, reverse transcriptase zinc-binding domain protein [Tanacetum cinerariifolium]